MDASMTQIECPIHSPEYVQNFSCRLHKKSPNSGSKSFSAEFSLRKDVNDVRGAYVFSFKQGKSIINYTAMEIDYCQALSALQSQILFKLIADELRRVSNFPLNCPFVMVGKNSFNYYNLIK